MSMQAEALTAIRAFIARQLVMGFSSDAEIAAFAAEYVESEHSDLDLESMVPHLVALACREYRAAQADWPPVTDCDRLDAVFTELNGEGIVARHNFTCCQTCGHREINDEIAVALEHGPVTGFVFYHETDAARAAEGGDLYLSYGDRDGDPGATLAVGRRIVACFTRHGFAVQWAEDIGQRIVITMDWKRRRPSA